MCTNFPLFKEFGYDTLSIVSVRKFKNRFNQSFQKGKVTASRYLCTHTTSKKPKTQAATVNTNVPGLSKNCVNVPNACKIQKSSIIYSLFRYFVMS